MLIHILTISLTFGFAILAALWARGIIREGAPYKPETNPLPYIWSFGGAGAVVGTVLMLGCMHITATVLYPLFQLLMIAGAFTITWYHLNTMAYRQKVRSRQRDKARARRQRRRTTTSRRTARPAPRTRVRR